tara:strand:+ start:245 stop:421 length:177 start_codon:yes stop_codon:yes gene_type:complete
MEPQRDKLKLIVRNLELLVDALKAEVYSDVDAYNNSAQYNNTPADYDELYDDDDGYAD